MIPGRKRKTGPRHPSGDLVLEDTPSPAQIRRAVGVAMTTARDASLGTQLGWMRLRREITDQQMAAGIAFARLHHDNARAIASPRRYAASASLEGFRGRCDSGEDAERTSEARRRYTTALDLLYTTGGTMVVIDVCVDDHAPAWGERKALLRGLDALVRHFGLGQGRGK